jgi:hypothetical protein
MSEDDKIVRLVARRENGGDKTIGEEDVPAFLRALAARIESGEFESAVVAGAVVILNVEQPDDKFCLKLRRTHMSWLQALGALQTMAHDMLHS